MKNNNLTTAIVAALAGIAGIASTTNAAKHINTDGLGSTLIYPYYTVNADEDGSALNTLISVVNTSDKVNAVKVRFLEGKNSREVLDFNLYLSAWDVWTAVLVPTADGGAAVKTWDTSCTVPTVTSGGIAFRPYAYDGTVGSSDRMDNSIGRTTEGHFEIIEMGAVLETVTNKLASSATHIDGTPKKCSVLASAWGAGGVWNNGAGSSDTDMGVAEGAIFGSATIVDVDNATAVSYNAQAIGSFWDGGAAEHRKPGDLRPSLNSGDLDSLVFDEQSGTAVTTNWPTGVEATSAPFVRDNIYQEYLTNVDINAETSYVVTFPTKRFYTDPAVNSAIATANTAAELYAGIAPFTRTSFISSVSGIGYPACEPVEVTFYDREEDTSTTELDFSPSPDPDGQSLCWETNVININGSDVLNSHLNSGLDLPFSEGWMQITFANQSTSRGDSVFGNTANLGDHTFAGLPVTGFSVLRFVNGANANGLSNYASLFSHTYSKNITVNP